ncbi:MAG: TolC family protein [Flaviaesturariibacter sp.]|nr:TolC family protein [Flaviaesturariibacter sp.]
MKHRRLKRVLVGAMVLLTTLTSFSQEKRLLTLKEAIDLSIKNSKQLKGSEARIAQATAALREAVDRKLPDASVSGSYLRLNKPNVSLKSKSSSSTGGGTPPTTEESPKPNAAAYLLANVSMPIYSGFRIKYGIESAKYLEQAARLDAEDDKEEIAANTIDAYNNLYKSKSAVDIVAENLETAQQRVNELSNLEKNGLLARNDLLKAQLGQSNIELALLDAQNNWQLANINMDLMLGLPETTEIVIDSSSLQTSANLKTIEEYVQAGLQNRKDLSALGYRKKAAETGVKATLGERYPSVAVTGGYVAMDVPHLLTVTNAVNLGLGVRYDIGSLWKNKAKVQQAQARVLEVQAGEAQLEDAIRLQVHQRYLAYLTGQKRIDVNATAVAQATENYRVINNKYKNSLATTTELLDADAALLQTRLNLSFAQSDAVVAYNKLLQAAGLLTTETK